MSSLQNEQFSVVFKPGAFATVSQEEIELLEHWIEEILLCMESEYRI